MKPFEEFSVEDLKEYIVEHNLMRQHALCTDERPIIDYSRIAQILGIKHRAVRKLVDGDCTLKRYHYNLLSLHTGELELHILAHVDRSFWFMVITDSGNK